MADLQWLAEKYPEDADICLFTALVVCAVGDRQAADAARKRYQQLAPSQLDAMLMEVIVALHFSEDGSWSDSLESLITAHPDDTQLLLDTARIYAMATQVVPDSDGQDEHAARAVTLIQAQLTWAITTMPRS